MVAPRCLFIDKPYCDIIIASLLHCHDHEGIRLYGCVVVLNHLHLGVDFAEW